MSPSWKKNQNACNVRSSRSPCTWTLKNLDIGSRTRIPPQTSWMSSTSLYLEWAHLWFLAIEFLTIGWGGAHFLKSKSINRFPAFVLTLPDSTPLWSYWSSTFNYVMNLIMNFNFGFPEDAFKRDGYALGCWFLMGESNREASPTFTWVRALEDPILYNVP